MITDKETNFVYFSGLLPKRHSPFFKELTVILKRKGIKHGLLPDTNDIWCRDYMPIQIAGNSFAQFKYYPKYLLGSKKYRETITDAKKTCEVIGIKPVISDIKIDGGNIVRSKTKVIMTERIFSENPRYPENELLKKLKTLLKVRQIILIPKKIEGSIGVVSAIRQGSVGFENWVQIEMSGILNGYIDEGDKIIIERKHDICIYGNNNNNFPKVVIEIKIIKNSERGIPAIKKDVDKLRDFEPNNMVMERAFFCVLYKSTGKIGCENTLMQISTYIGELPPQVIVRKNFNVSDNNGGNIEVVLYLNRWGGIRPEL